MLKMLDRLYIAARAGVTSFQKEERGAVTIVEIVVMIGIAVLLAVLFRKQIESLLNNLFGQITGKANEAMGD